MASLNELHLLSPHLSSLPGERENRPPSLGHTRDGVCRVSVRKTRDGRRLSPAHEPEFEMRLFLSLPVRHERGESRREGLSKIEIPPLPNPLLPPASGREGETAGRPRVQGTRRAESPGGSLPEGEEKREFLLHRMSHMHRTTKLLWLNQ